ncbi:MAG: diguanylate cyclase [Sulfurospirillaceae bacterium]|nr:diguanylate cyclase [Sulfurospirillaceae bacterium]
MINCEKIIDSINVGIMTIDADLNIYYMNRWFSIHSEFTYTEDKPLNLLDIFELSHDKIKALKRHIKAALTLGSPSFYTADSNHYLFAMKHSLTIKSIFDVMQQDVTIVPYNIAKKQVTILVYDQTTLMEEKAKCHRENSALAEAVKIANDTIKKLESAQRTLVKQKDIIYKQAHYDQLTSLANRTLLQERLQLLIEECTEKNKKFGVLFLDMDGFKEVNDTLGHDVGDDLLVHTAQLLLNETRKTDTVARFGGDEFVILISDTSESILQTIATKLIHAAAQPLNIKGHYLTVTLSIGISIFPEHGKDFNTLIKSADLALYKAKAMGKNNFKSFDSTL